MQAVDISSLSVQNLVTDKIFKNHFFCSNS